METKSRKILVVDDNTDSIRFITETLLFDHIVYATTKSEIALKKAESTLPDLIITDWDMPVVNGLELITQIKNSEIVKHIPIIIVTGVMTDIKDLSRAFETGAVDYLTKPLNIIELRARVESMLRIVKLQEYQQQQQQLLFEKEKLILQQNKRQLENALIHFSGQNELLQEVVMNLKELKNQTNEKGDQIIYKLLLKLSQSISKSGWNEFDLSFNTLYTNFNENIIAKFPNLTANEKRICAFLKLNMQTKEIAAITSQTTNSIDVARFRLRKKLNLGTTENIHVFLQQF